MPHVYLYLLSPPRYNSPSPTADNKASLTVNTCTLILIMSSRTMWFSPCRLRAVRVTCKVGQLRNRWIHFVRIMFIPFDVFQPTSTRKNLRVGLMGLLRTAESYRGDTTAAAGCTQRCGGRYLFIVPQHCRYITAARLDCSLEATVTWGEQFSGEHLATLWVLRRRQLRSYMDGSRFQM